MQIDKYKIKIKAFTAELEEPLDRTRRCFILTEAEIHDVSHPDNHDGTFNEVFTAKVVGATEIKQGNRVVKGKSKRRYSQRLRGQIFYKSEEEGKDAEKEYEKFMQFLLAENDLVWNMYQKSNFS